MTRTEAAEHALTAIEFERLAIRYCDSLSNPRYQDYMRRSQEEKMRAENFFEAEGT